MANFRFKNIDKLKRNRDIEGITGTELGLGAGITLTVLCASDANPRWRQFGDDYTAEVRRLIKAKASEDRVKKFQAAEFARLFVIAWEGVVDADDNPIPMTLEACTAFLYEADDAIPAIQETVFETKFFRGQRVEAVATRVGE